MGKIHSLESFGTVDGPGVRFVAFFQGCPMRCKYCHNPDTWNPLDGKDMTANEILEKMLRNISFYEKGGITATGGEPMLQIDFLTELFKLAKDNNIHTCLDTSGIMFTRKGEFFSKIESLMSVTDLVMLDIKHVDKEEHLNLTGKDNKDILDFLTYLDEVKKKTWLRHVVVPGITFVKEELEGFKRLAQTVNCVEKIELLPYHSMGKVKYDSLGINYPLEGVKQLTKEELKQAENIVFGTL